MTEMISVFLPLAMMVLMLSLGPWLDPGEAGRGASRGALLAGLGVQMIGFSR
ncbi:MAG: hypothetical protein R3D59_14060 [Paracoccaceae bacterium]